MIEAKNLTKKFDSIVAVDHIDARIKDGCVFGLIGTNGAGKSTFLRMACGVLKPDEGTIQIDGEDVYENTKVKGRFFYISDDQFFFGNGTPQEMMTFYKSIYPSFDVQRACGLLESFSLDKRRKVSTFSKGMKKQLSVILGLCANTEYLFCDETFDGLDPVIRLAARKLIADEVSGRGMTALISSHNLRELEDLCDHVAILHEGRLLMTREMDNLRTSYCKVQTAFKPAVETLDLPGLSILRTERVGSVWTLLVRGSEEEVFQALRPLNPVILDCISLTLEEVFISEMEAVGYDYNHIIF